MRMPNAAKIAEMHEQLEEIFAEDNDPISPPGIKSYELLESAAFRPFTSIGSVEKYPTPFLKIAALTHSLTKNHAFNNGNKRIGLYSLIATLYYHDYILKKDVTDAQVFDLSLSISQDICPLTGISLPTDDMVISISEWIRRNSEKLSRLFSEMKTSDFARKCEEAGCDIKWNNGAVSIRNHGVGSIRISRSTRKLTGNAIRRYLRDIGLTLTLTGIDQIEFRNGISGERSQIYRYMSAMRQLART
jgi:prophage maintenance system killer protein